MCVPHRLKRLPPTATLAIAPSTRCVQRCAQRHSIAHIHAFPRLTCGRLPVPIKCSNSFPQLLSTTAPNFSTTCLQSAEPLAPLSSSAFPSPAPRNRRIASISGTLQAPSKRSGSSRWRRLSPTRSWSIPMDHAPIHLRGLILSLQCTCS